MNCGNIRKSLTLFRGFKLNTASNRAGEIELAIMVEAAGFSFRLDPKSLLSVILLANSGFKELQLMVQR